MSIINQIKKRSGDIVDFDHDKIVIAVQKAFQAALPEKLDDELVSKITDHVIAHLENQFKDKTPSVEDVQDIVEKVLVEEGFYYVAKAYILYRYEHAKEREEKKRATLAKIEKNTLYVIKSSGKKEKFNEEKLKKSFSWAIKGLEDVIDVEAIALQCKNSLYDNIPTLDISKTLILTTRSFIERDPAYAKLAAYLLLDTLYKEVIGPETIDFKKLETEYRQAFIKNLKKGVEIDRLDKSILDFDLEKISQALVIERDKLLLYLGLQTLYDRYFISDPHSKQILETPQAFWMRAAMGLALNEKKEDREAYAIKFYEVISTLRFVPSTPTLFHAGTTHPQLSSCYLTTVEDSLDHIFKCIGDNAQLSKWSGGIGNDWSNIRGTGALIKGTAVDSQGVIPFLKIANDTTVAINRSGRRRGATCAYLETWHYDIEDFLELRKNTGDERRRTHDMNTANWIPDLFMKRVRDDGMWTLFSPHETPDLHHLYGKKFEERYLYYEKLADQNKLQLHKKIKAKDLWKKMLTMLFETGHPWITFKDPCNIRSPQDHVGVVHSSNLCTEITLNTSSDETAVCNLGSVNLTEHLDKNKQTLNLDLINATVTTAMRMLDNVIDINFYPTKEAKNSNLRHRPVGLGVMGFHDALYTLNINFDSENCLQFADYSMEVISYYAILASTKLAAERGAYESYKGSKWDRGIFPIDTLDLMEQERGEKIDVPRVSQLDWSFVREAVKKNGMRNSNCLAIAPTATISNIAGCVPSIEPIYKNIYVKSNMSGEFTINNPYLVEDLKKLGLWNEAMMNEIKRYDGNISEIGLIPKHIKDKYKETFDIDSEILIKAAAYRGKWIDQSQSLNIFIKGTSGQRISDVYLYSWKMGLKTTYYLRSLAATNIEKSTLNLTQQQGTLQLKKTTEGEAVPATGFDPKPIAACKIADPTCEACQ